VWTQTSFAPHVVDPQVTPPLASVICASTAPPSHGPGNASTCVQRVPSHRSRLQNWHGSLHVPHVCPGCEHGWPSSVLGSAGHTKDPVSPMTSVMCVTSHDSIASVPLSVAPSVTTVDPLHPAVTQSAKTKTRAMRDFMPRS
jgi:hypothetical protein